jgi:hypothetical protein
MAWLQIYAIAREAEAYRKYYRQNPPVACPNDGEPLLIGPDSSRFCKFDGWKWDGTNGIGH